MPLALLRTRVDAAEAPRARAALRRRGRCLRPPRRLRGDFQTSSPPEELTPGDPSAPWQVTPREALDIARQLTEHPWPRARFMDYLTRSRGGNHIATRPRKTQRRALMPLMFFQFTISNST